MSEIEYLKNQIREATEAYDKLSKKETYDKMSSDLRNIYESLVDQGFTEEQAFTIFMEMLKKGCRT